MNYMLMNGAVSPDAEHEEFRVAILKGAKGKLYNFFVDLLGQEERKSNIYKARIMRIEPSLEAVFVDYGTEKHGFLPFKEISEVYLKPVLPDEKPFQTIKERLAVGQELMVQIDKDERGSKGAALTTFVSLAGRYLVLMPNRPPAAGSNPARQAGGISRRIEGENRENLKENLHALEVPENMGLIIRTASAGKNLEELRWDLNILIKLWEAIEEAYQSRSGPFLIHQESSIIVRAIRDYMREDIDEILIDDPQVFEEAHTYVKQVRPDFLPRVKLYQSPVPLFSQFQIESQIEAAFQHEVRLPSGGVIVIDHTEALVSIDINSSRATRGGDIEETALNTNLEAADEIARQLRLRDTGGLIVIDFIDMHSNHHQRKVEERLRAALEEDRARVQVGRISRFGLLEMSRQRLRNSLGEATEITCPRCSGHGTVRTIPSLTLSILRLIEEEALKENTRAVHAQLPVDVATFVLNEKRDRLFSIEKTHGVEILIIPNLQLISPHYKIERVRGTDQKTVSKSYELSETPQIESKSLQEKKDKRQLEEPAVKSLSISQHPVSSGTGSGTDKSLKPNSNSKKGLLTRLLDNIFGSKPEEKSLSPNPEPVIKPEPPKPVRTHPQRNSRTQHNPRNTGNTRNPRVSSGSETTAGKNRDHRTNNRTDNRTDNRQKPRHVQQNMPQKPAAVMPAAAAIAAPPPPQNVPIEVILPSASTPMPVPAPVSVAAPETPSSIVPAAKVETPQAVSSAAEPPPPEIPSADDLPRSPYYHKRRGRHLRRGGGNNYRQKQDDTPPDDKN